MIDRTKQHTKRDSLQRGWYGQRRGHATSTRDSETEQRRATRNKRQIREQTTTKAGSWSVRSSTRLAPDGFERIIWEGLKARADGAKEDLGHRVRGEARIVGVVRSCVDHVLIVAVLSLCMDDVEAQEVTYPDAIDSCDLVVEFLEGFGSVFIVSDLRKLDAEAVERYTAEVEAAGGVDDDLLRVVS